MNNGLNTYHSFSTVIAELYGLNCAVVLNNIVYWVTYNEANDINFINGKYWTHNTCKAFKKFFPYLSEKQIWTAIKKLQDEGILEAGQFNNSSFDHERWYTLTEKACELLCINLGKIDFTCRENRNSLEGNSSILYNKTHIKTNICSSEQEERIEEENCSPYLTTRQIEDEFEQVWALYPRKQGKMKALAAYTRARRDGEKFEDVKRGIERYAAYIKRTGTEPQYIKMGQTYFNGRCWGDDYGFRGDNSENPNNSYYASLHAMNEAADKKADREHFYAVRRQRAEEAARAAEERALKDDAYSAANKEIKRLEIKIAREEVSGGVNLQNLLNKIGEARELRLRAMNRLGLSEADFVPKYSCEKCSDTGFLANGAMCNCYYEYLHAGNK